MQLRKKNDVQPVSAANVLQAVIMPIDVEIGAVFLNVGKLIFIKRLFP
jgi:hypothetical protein